MPSRRNHPQRIKARERELEAAQLRGQGLGYVEIGQRMGMSTAGAHRCVQRLVNRNAMEPLEESRALELTRMDQIVQTFIPLLGHPKYRFRAAEILIEVSKHRCRILGITEPAALNFTAQMHSRIDAEYERLTAELERLDQPPEDNDYPVLEASAIELDGWTTNGSSPA